tara:strand:+ start:153 stop:3407 length:3255 start_codon:yes stop_codon:yes gene_type:complete
MAISRNRDLAGSLGQAVKNNTITADGSLSITGLTSYDSSGLLPTSYDSSNSGTLGFAKDSDRLYVHTGQGWFNIAIVNTTPIFTTSPNGSYDLATDATAYKNGTATTITIQARDSEGFPVTYAATGNTAFNNMAHVDKDSAAGFIFTVEPKTQDSAGSAIMPTGTLTFTATDGINIASAASTFTLTFDTTVANSENTVLLTKAVGNDGTNDVYVDAGNSNTVTAVLDAVTEKVQQGTFSPYSPSGYSWYLSGPGTHNGISTTDLGIGSSEPWTMEVWINHQSTTSGALFNFAASTSTLTFMLYLGLTSGTDVGFKLYAGSELINVSAETIEKNRWYHVALTRQSDNYLRLYVDGVLKGTSSSTYANALGAATWISRWHDNNGHNYKGYLHDWRVVKGKAVYTGNFTPPSGPLTKTGGKYPSTTNIVNPTSSETKLLLCNSPMFKDVETGLTITDINNDIEIIAYSPYRVAAAYSASDHGGSAEFIYTSQGSGSYIAIDDTASGKLAQDSTWFNASGFTLEGWFYFKDYTKTNTGLWDNRSGGNNVGFTIALASSGASLNFYCNGSTLNIGSSPFKNKQWYHVAYTFVGTVVKCYINGVLRGTGTSQNTASYDYFGTAHSGNVENTLGSTQYTPRGQNYLDGFISDFRIKAGAVYTGDFTPPTSPLTSTGSKLHLTFTNGKILDEGGRFNLNVLGNTQSDTGIQKYSIPSILFDGSDDYITIPDNEMFNFGSNDFTIEGWIYPAALGNYDTVVSQEGTWAIELLNSKLAVWLSTGTSASWDILNAALISDTLSANQWVHFALTRNGSSIKGYIDGVEKYSATKTETIGNSSQDLKIGMYGTTTAHTWNGNISDLRISRNSRYPFVPVKETLTTSKSFQDGITVTASNTKLLMAHIASLTDGSTSGHTITAAGNAAVSDFAPTGGMKSIYFDGSGDKLTIGSHSDFALGTGNFTLEFWYYAPSIGGNMVIMEQGSNQLRVVVPGGGGINVYHSGGNGPQYGTLTAKRWYHVAVVRYGTGNDESSIFINGSRVHSTTTNGNIGAGAITFGMRTDGSDPFTGYISNLRIQNQAIYTKNFTPPAAALQG